MLCNFHSVPTKPWIPHQNTATQVGKNLWQKPVIISSRTYINNPKEYHNSIGGVWARHWCQQLKEKKHFKFKVRPSWFVFFPILRDGKTKWTHPIHLENFRWESPKVIPFPLIASHHPIAFYSHLQASVRLGHPGPNHQAARQLDETMGFRVWEKWQSFHSFQLSALRIVEISKPKFFFHKNLMSVVRIVCQKNLVSRL